MDITMIGKDCAKITLTAKECSQLDICYESFSPDSLEARLFLASVIARLESMGANMTSADKLTAEVFEDDGKGLVMYLSGKGVTMPQTKENMFPLLCRTTDQVVEASRKLRGCWELYSTREGYYFVSPEDDSINAAKIREHGRLISHAPLERLRALY